MVSATVRVPSYGGVGDFWHSWRDFFSGSLSPYFTILKTPDGLKIKKKKLVLTCIFNFQKNPILNLKCHKHAGLEATWDIAISSIFP